VTVAIQRRRACVGSPRASHSHACMHACTQSLLMTHARTTLGPRNPHKRTRSPKPNALCARSRSLRDSDSGGTPQNESYERTLARSALSGTPISLILSSLSDAVTAESTRSRTASSAADRPSASTCSRRVDTRAAA
jgi:hypothetical protein